MSIVTLQVQNTSVKHSLIHARNGCVQREHETQQNIVKSWNAAQNSETFPTTNRPSKKKKRRTVFKQFFSSSFLFFYFTILIRYAMRDEKNKIQLLFVCSAQNPASRTPTCRQEAKQSKYNRKNWSEHGVINKTTKFFWVHQKWAAHTLTHIKHRTYAMRGASARICSSKDKLVFNWTLCDSSHHRPNEWRKKKTLSLSDVYDDDYDDDGYYSCK